MLIDSDWFVMLKEERCFEVPVWGFGKWEVAVDTVFEVFDVAAVAALELFALQWKLCSRDR